MVIRQDTAAYGNVAASAEAKGRPSHAKFGSDVDTDDATHTSGRYEVFVTDILHFSGDMKEAS